MHKVVFGLLVIFTFQSQLLFVYAADLPKYTSSRALLIGEARYQNGWEKLPSVTSEIERLQVQLRKIGFSVKKYSDLDSNSFHAALKEFAENEGADPNARLLIFISGHGDTRAHQTRGYFAPIDTPLLQVDETDFLKKAISMNEFVSFAKGIKAKHVLILFDSCFSGSIFLANSRQVGGVGRLDLPVRQIITAGAADEKLPAKSEFVNVIINALRGEADVSGRGFFTGSDLAFYVAQQMALNRSGQTPQSGKIDEFAQGEIVFGPYNKSSFGDMRNAIGSKVDLLQHDVDVELRASKESPVPLYKNVPRLGANLLYGNSIIMHGCWGQGCIQDFFFDDSNGRLASLDVSRDENEPAGGVGVLSVNFQERNSGEANEIRQAISKFETETTTVRLHGYVRGTDWASVTTHDGLSIFVDRYELEDPPYPVSGPYPLSLAQRIFSEFALKRQDVPFGHYHSGIDGLMNDGLRSAILAYKNFKNDEDAGQPRRRLDAKIDAAFIGDLDALGCWDGC